MLTWTRHPRHRSARPHFRPHLECLEQRAVPAGQLNHHYHFSPLAGNLGTDGIAETFDGKVVLAGNDANGNILVTRLLANGATDPTFGHGGLVTINPNLLNQQGQLNQIDAANFNVTAVAINYFTGQIFVGGACADDSGFLRFAAVRLGGNGQFDPSYGTGGVALVNGTALLGFSGMAVSPWGQLTMAGEEQGPFFTTDDFGDGFSPTRLDVVRFTPAGQPDRTFAANDPAQIPGVATVVFWGMSTAVPTSFAGISGTMPIPDSFVSGGSNGLVLTPAGNILVAGTDLNTVNFTCNFAVVKLTSAGQLDTHFGTSMPGVTTVSDGSGADSGSSLALTLDGDILVGGTSGSSFAVACLEYNGSLDTDFAPASATPGISILANVNLIPSFVGITLSCSGQILLDGTALDASTGLADFAVARLSANGTADRTFGTGGVTITSFGTQAEGAASGVVVLPNGQIVVAGTELAVVNQTFEFFIIALEYSGH
jgi:uncharacterized delta-60 repeat protein